MLRNAGWWVGITTWTIGRYAGNVTAEVKARHATSNYGAYGLIFCLSNDWSQFYLFIVDSNDREYNIWKYNNGSWTDLKDWTYSSYINGGAGSNLLKIVRNGANIMVYANNYLLTTVSDGSYTGYGRVGLYVHTWSSGPGNVDVRFDNFKVCGIAHVSTAAEEETPYKEGQGGPAGS